MTTYINISERYGEQVEATIADYLALNPNGKFIETENEIRELNVYGPYPQDYEIVATTAERVEDTIQWNISVEALNS